MSANLPEQEFLITLRVKMKGISPRKGKISEAGAKQLMIDKFYNTEDDLEIVEIRITDVIETTKK